MFKNHKMVNKDKTENTPKHSPQIPRVPKSDNHTDATEDTTQQIKEKKCKVNGKEEYWCDECDTHKQPLFVCELLKDQRKQAIEEAEKIIDEFFDELLQENSAESISEAEILAMMSDKLKSKLKEMK